jgi:hypothetical protein
MENCILKRVTPGSRYTLTSDGWLIGSTDTAIKTWTNPEGMFRELLSADECNKLFDGVESDEIPVTITMFKKLDINKGTFEWTPKFDKNGCLTLQIKNNDKN